jgi:predicted transcriptional regulator
MSGFSRRERQILDILFESNEATAQEIRQSMEDPPTDATVRTLLRVLVEKEAVTYRKDGKRFVYRPRMRKSSEGKSALKRVLNVFYDGSLRDALAAHLADPKTKLDDETIEELRALIESAEKKSSRKGSKDD